MPPCTPRRGYVAVAASVAVALTLTACGSDGIDEASAGVELRVVTTVAPITSIVAAVAGSRARVDGLVPEGTNSHTFEPPPSAARVLAEADLVFLNGLQLEEPTKELAEENLGGDAELVELGTTVLPPSDYLYDFSFPEDEGKPNPHLWTDPTYAIRYAEVVRDVLARTDPEGREIYGANFAAFEQQASALSDAVRSDQGSLDPTARELLTYHDAYAYFAKTYGWRIVGAIQPSDFSEPTPKEIARLIDQIRTERVKAIFGSEVFPSEALDEIARATGVAYEDTLRDDDLPGAPGAPEHSWLELMRSNFRTIIARLGGTTGALDRLETKPVVPDTANYPQ